MRFGLDGLLYASLGDDASMCSAQTPGFRGAILRLEARNTAGGRRPARSAPRWRRPDNPFAGVILTPQRDCRRVTALRNPFRFQLDTATGDLVIGDVGLCAARGAGSAFTTRRAARVALMPGLNVQCAAAAGGRRHELRLAVPRGRRPWARTRAGSALRPASCRRSGTTTARRSRDAAVIAAGIYRASRRPAAPPARRPRRRPVRETTTTRARSTGCTSRRRVARSPRRSLASRAPPTGARSFGEDLRLARGARRRVVVLPAVHELRRRAAVRSAACTAPATSVSASWVPGRDSRCALRVSPAAGRGGVLLSTPVGAALRILDTAGRVRAAGSPDATARIGTGSERTLVWDGRDTSAGAWRRQASTSRGSTAGRAHRFRAASCCSADQAPGPGRGGCEGMLRRMRRTRLRALRAPARARRTVLSMRPGARAIHRAARARRLRRQTDGGSPRRAHGARSSCQTGGSCCTSSSCTGRVRGVASRAVGVQAKPRARRCRSVTTRRRRARVAGDRARPGVPRAPVPSIIHYTTGPPNHIRIARWQSLTGDLGRQAGELGPRSRRPRLSRYDLIDDIQDQCDEPQRRHGALRVPTATST